MEAWNRLSNLARVPGDPSLLQRTIDEHEHKRSNEEAEEGMIQDEVVEFPAAAAGGGAAQLPEGPTFCRFDEDNWLDEVQTADDSWCFLCEFSQNAVQFDGNRDYGRLLTLMRDHYGKLRPKTFCEMIQTFYNNRLKGCIDEPREWSLCSIYNHIERHRPEPIAMTVDTLRTITSAMHVLRDSGMCSVSTLPDGTRQKAIHSSNTRLYLTLADRQQKLISTIARMGHSLSAQIL
jgi:hypothetical protein